MKYKFLKKPLLVDGHKILIEKASLILTGCGKCNKKYYTMHFNGLIEKNNKIIGKFNDAYVDTYVLHYCPKDFDFENRYSKITNEIYAKVYITDELMDKISSKEKIMWFNICIDGKLGKQYYDLLQTVLGEQKIKLL